jgi:hypothetical protein
MAKEDIVRFRFVEFNERAASLVPEPWILLNPPYSHGRLIQGNEHTAYPECSAIAVAKTLT